MISRINKVQKIANQNTSPIQLNTSLPISLKVSEKIGYNRYILKFANRSLNTRSLKQLKVGANYWGEIGSNSENIVITGLFEKPNFDSIAFDDGLWIIEKLVGDSDMKWFYSHITDKLTNTNQKSEFEIYADMFLALQSNIINVPFVYSGISGIFQLKKGVKTSEIYLVFSNFAPLNFTLNDNEITQIKTPFKKVASLLKSEFLCDVKVDDTQPLWIKNRNLVDYKG